MKHYSKHLNKGKAMEDIATAIVLALMILIAVLVDIIYTKYTNKTFKDDYVKSDYLTSKEWKNKAKNFKEEFTK